MSTETPGTATRRLAVRGADAVVSPLGPSLDRKATEMPLVDGARNIVDGMRAEGVQRYVGMATPSLRDPRDRLRFRRAAPAISNWPPEKGSP